MFFTHQNTGKRINLLVFKAPRRGGVGEGGLRHPRGGQNHKHTYHSSKDAFAIRIGVCLVNDVMAQLAAHSGLGRGLGGIEMTGKGLHKM